MNSLYEVVENSAVDPDDAIRPLWDGFRDFVQEKRDKEHRRKNALAVRIKAYKRKDVNPIRAELYTCLVQYVGRKIELLKSVMAELQIEDMDDFIQNKDYFTPAENFKYSIILVVDYALESLQERQIFNFICYVRMQEIYRIREKVQWDGYELKKGVSDSGLPNGENSTLSDAELERARSRVRKRLRGVLRAENHENMFVNTLRSENDIIFIGIMEASKTVRKRGAPTEQIKCTATVLALDPTLPYICAYSQKDALELILQALPTLPGGYVTAKNMHLRDSGLSAVMTSMSKVSSSYTAFTSSFKHRLEDDEELEERLGIREMKDFQKDAKRRKFLKNLIDDKQEGGFKNFTMEFVQPKAPQLPITFKFKTKNGKMNEVVADLFEQRVWNNPIPYLKARDMKTNFIRLKVNENSVNGEYCLDDSQDVELE